MKTFFAVLVLIYGLSENVHCSYSDILLNVERLSPEAIIDQLSELIRSLIINGDAAIGVPVLDPYEFRHLQLNYLGEILKVNANIRSGNLIGLSNFRLQQFNFSKSEISIEFNVNIPSLEFNSEHYELAGTIYDAVPLKGQGVVYIAVNNLTLWGKVYLKQSPDGTAVLLDRFENTEFSVEQIVSRTQFDNNIDEIISAMVEDLLASYLTRFSKFVTTTYSEKLVQHINKSLEQYETWSLIDAIMSIINKS